MSSTQVLNEMHIMCIPVSMSPHPPTNQPDCEIEDCPKCGNQMWISRKKRMMRDKTQSHYIVKCWCMDCLITIHVKEMKLKHANHKTEFNIIDLTKVNL